jgi:hypothetical protein
MLWSCDLKAACPSPVCVAIISCGVEWNFNSSFKPGRHGKGVAEEFEGRDEEAGIARIKGE